MLRSYSFDTVTVDNSSRGNEQAPRPVNAPLPNGLSSRPQVINLGADAVHTNIPDTQATPQADKPKMPNWVWYVAAAAIIFILIRK